MKLPAILCALSCGLFATAAAAPGKKPALLVACIEPAALRTDTSQFLSGAKKTVISPARPSELGLSRLTKEEFAATGLKWDEFLREAGGAAAAHFRTLKPDVHRNERGTALYVVLKSESHLTAGVILCPELYARYRVMFGDRLVVLMPNRFTVYVFPRNFGGFQTMGPAILKEFAESTWPCSQEAFEISGEGIKCLGAFDTGEGGDDAPALPFAPVPAVPAPPSTPPVPETPRPAGKPATKPKGK